MSEWDRKYHRGKNLNLKITLISAGIIAALLIGLTVSERIVYAITFPESSESVSIEGILFTIEIESYFSLGLFLGSSGYRIYGVNLVANNNSCDHFPENVNATRVWVIPTKGGLWPWLNFEIFSLVEDKFTHKTASCAPYAFDREEVYMNTNYPHICVIVEIIANNGIHYINSRNDYDVPF